MDADAPLLSSFSGWPQKDNGQECMPNSLSVSVENGVSVSVDVSDDASHETCSSGEHQHQFTNTENCGKCLQLELELKKAKIEVLNLKKRCHDKAAEIKRIRASEQRSKSSKSSLEEMVRELKQKKWITDEGQAAMNVNELHI